ncbi:sodium:solute symporter [soil metagenome]
MSPIDLGVVIVYVVGVTALGAWLGARSEGLRDYFLGSSQIPAWAVMISIVATETSTATFLSVPGIAYKADFTYLQLAIGYLIGRAIVSAVLLPSYFRGEIFTAYQVLQNRFGGATKTTASILFLITRTLGDGLRLFLAAKVLQLLYLGMQGPDFQPHGWEMPLAILAVGGMTILYTYIGGMKAVIWTDVIQFAVYMLGAVFAMGLMAHLLPGGWAEIWRAGSAEGKFRLFDFGLDLTRPYTFWAGVLGGMVLNTATHGADQLMVQRYLSARSQQQAAGALLVSGVVVLAQFALFLLIGVGLWVFYQEFPPVNAANPEVIHELKADEEFTYFIVNYLPTGVLGLVVAAIFSAAMSTLSSSLNASASSTVNDLYRPLVPKASERHLLRLSRGLTLVWGLAQMGVAYAAIGLQDNVVNNALAIASFVTGLLLGVFLLGILTQRVGQTAALIGLWAGLAAVSYAKFGPLLPGWLYPFDGALAWPWYALVGSTTVYAVGWLASFVFPSKDPFLDDKLT